MSEVTLLSASIRAYEEIKAAQTELKAQLSEVTAQLEAAERVVIGQLLDLAETTGVANPRVSVDGRNYSVTESTYYRIPKEKRDVAFPALRELGLDFLIQEKVDDRTLTKELAVRAEANGGVLPEEYGALALESYSKPRLNNRKV